MQEQAKWHGRQAKLVRVEYKLGKTVEEHSEEKQGQGQQFDIEDSASILNLYDNMLKFFVELPKFSTDSVHFTELAIALKKFVPIMSGDKLCMSMENLVLAEKSITQPTLRLYCQPNGKTLAFEHTLLGAIRITSDLKYENHTTCDAQIPKLVEESELQSYVGFHLLQEFYTDTSCKRLIVDYTSYDIKKHHFFSKWLKEEKPQIEGLDDVQFVTFQGRLLRSLKTTLNQTFGEWETYAINIDNIIYLWDEKSVRTKSSFLPETAYMGELFEQIVSGRAPKNGGCIDGLEKVFPVQKVSFGSHKVLMMSNVDAQDSEGRFLQVQIQTDSNCYKRKNASLILEKNLKLWSQAVVSGCNWMVVGYKTFDNHITKIDTVGVDEFSPNAEDKEQCYDFLNRLLDWIKAHLPVPDEKLVKKFSWIPGKQQVMCHTIQEKEIEKLLVPKIYFPKD
ncbi:uncharacterized protein LOC110863535 [Folsomia candida]|uniref:uncharacterized protein LOC110863535 n=1 Tax=Folsomia candida TaxID=158441 RepID=UPI000B8F517F|nr:uncharacterized protein LOC110863535 [Folsomia candida]XP_035702541.1 uncharacterized protein LOC110863535 [Folsomia candida]XP_035702542.1 uncharacterized protein LOC110863535 [Folsomia candida]XP_035702543.1 uncharacterized protein LOC110863535 [Folsomia candida]